MPVVVIAPDSFKGGLTAPQAAQAMADGVRRAWPDAEIRLAPMADGGEGTLDAVLAATGGERLVATVTGAHGRPVEAAWGRLGDGTGVIEVAQVVGITLPGVAAVPVAHRTTVGVGELVRDCLGRGIRRVWVGLGGSATSDGGAGMLAALGVRFLDRDGHALEPTLAGLATLDTADFSGLDRRLEECELVLLSDVDNPLCGSRGATAVFGPQKGVAPGEVAGFDARLRRLADLGDRWRASAVSESPGSGAAGGLGYALGLLGGRHRSGAEAVCQLIGLDAMLERAQWAITGEGRSDLQTLEGKAPFVVAGHARQRGVPVTLISGEIDPSALPRLGAVFDSCFSLVSPDVSPEGAMADAVRLLAERAEQAGRAYPIG
jgi:glycerate kinase